MDSIGKKRGSTTRRRRKSGSRRLLAWLVPVILVLACANGLGLWLLWSSGGADRLLGSAGAQNPAPFALPAPRPSSEPTPTATLVVVATPTSEPTLTPTPTLPPTDTPLPVSIPAALPTATPVPAAGTGYVVIITVDGLRPDALFLAHTPNLDGLIARGAYQSKAKTLSISRTLPAHASLLDGMLPEKHGIVWGEPYIGWPGIKGSTLFSVAHDAGFSTGMVFGKAKLNYLVLPNSVDKLFGLDDVSDTEIKNRAVEFIQAGPPQILFIHLPDTDRVGHIYGWMSEQQLQAITFADKMIGEILAALETGGYLERTLVIVTSDHGGHGLNHGDDSPEDRTIPWLAAGPGIRRGILLNGEVNIYDTAPTVLYALKLPVPSEWDGRPVLEIFDQLVSQ